MPNLSVAQTQAKKRKMSSVSTSCSTSTNTASIDLTMPQSGGRVDQLKDKDAALDDAILNSEVYKVSFLLGVEFVSQVSQDWDKISTNGLWH